MQSATGSLASSPAATAPPSPTHSLASVGGDGGGDHYYFFFSAPASPVHYILRSPPSSTAEDAVSASSSPLAEDAGDFEFTARHQGGGAMCSAEELFLGGRIRVGRLAPIRQENDDGDEEEDRGVDSDGGAPRLRRAMSVSPPRSLRLGKKGEPPERFASASSSASSSSSSSSSAKGLRRRISLRDLLGRPQGEAAAAGAERPGFWPPSIWPKKALPSSLATQPGRRSTSSDRVASAARSPGRRDPRRRTTSLPYRQGLLLGCLGLGARSYGLAKSMHPLSSK